MNFDTTPSNRTETRIISANMVMMKDYYQLESATHKLNVKDAHVAHLDQLSAGGNSFDKNSLSLALGSAISMSPSRGMLPLFDNGNLTPDGIKRQYRGERFATQLNIEYRSGYDTRGAITLFFYSDRAEVQGRGIIPNNLMLTLNSATIYRYVPNSNGRFSPKRVFSGRIHGKQQLNAVRSNPNQFAGGLTSLDAFSNNDGVGGDFGMLSNTSVGAYVAETESLATDFSGGRGEVASRTIDLRRAGNIFTGDSFDNASQPRLINDLFNGYNIERDRQNSVHDGSKGKFINDERELYSIAGDVDRDGHVKSGHNPIASRWNAGAGHNNEDMNVSHNPVITTLRKAVPSFAENATISYGALKKVFRDLDKNMNVAMEDLHTSYQKTFNMVNDPLNHNSDTIESALSRQVVQYVAPIIASKGFYRFSFMMTNRAVGSLGAGRSRSSIEVLANLDHPFMNKDRDALRVETKDVSDQILREVAPFLDDFGHRDYKIMVHYVFRGDARVTIDLGGGPKNFTPPTFCDHAAAASASFDSNKDIASMGDQVRGIMDQLGRDYNNGSFGGSRPKPTPNQFREDSDKSSWGSMQPTTSGLKSSF